MGEISMSIIILTSYFLLFFAMSAWPGLEDNMASLVCVCVCVSWGRGLGGAGLLHRVSYRIVSIGSLSPSL